MSMLGHSMAAMIVLQNGDEIIGECWLDNEESVVLSDDISLFHGCKKSAEIPQRILKGFLDSDGMNAEDLIRDSDVMGTYAAFEKKASKVAFSKIHSIFLMNCLEQEYKDHRYAYNWIQYDLKNGTIAQGTGNGDSSYDAEKFLKKLAEEVCGNTSSKEDTVSPKKEVPIVGHGMSLEAFGETFEYFIREDDEYFFETLFPRGITIMKYKGTEKVVTVPEVAGGLIIRHIASFGNNPWVENLILPEGVTVSDDAFIDCPRICRPDENGYVVAFGKLIKAEIILPKMVLPQGIVSICYNLFESNDEIEEGIIPEGVEEIGFGAFSSCRSLKRVTFPKTLKRISDCAFMYSTALTEVVFPETLSYIGEQAFLGCKSLNKVVISPKTECAARAFSGCGKALAREDGITCINGMMYDLIIEKHLEFHGYSYRNSEWYFTVPGDITKIVGSTIFNASSRVAESFTITDNVEYIDPEGFLLSGIKLFRIIDHVTQEILFETDAFRKSRLSDSSKFETFCELVAQKDYDTLRKQFGGSQNCKKAAPKNVIAKSMEAVTDIPSAKKLNENGLSCGDVLEYEAFNSSMGEMRKQWLSDYGAYLEKSPLIVFSGKSFVLSGMDMLGDEHGISIEEEIASRGGVVRKDVSGKTDYLVVDPEWAGESKIKKAIEQQKKGKPVKIILGTDLIAEIQ